MRRERTILDANHDRLRVGLLGTGNISDAHIRAWERIDEARIACVCDADPQRRAAAAERTGAMPCADFEALAASGADIADILLPTWLHAEYAVKALERGMHVLLEKPVSLDRADVRRIYDAAAANDRRIMVAQVVRFWPEYMALRDAFLDGRYGRLLSGHMTRLGSTPGANRPWMREADRSGLVPFDLHIHDLDFIVSTFGAPADTVTRRARTDRQDYFQVIYQFPDFFITAEAAWFDCKYKFQCAFRFQFERAVMEYRDGRLTTYLQDGTSEALPPSVSGEAYYNEIRYFTDCVLAGRDCARVHPEELETVLDLLHALEK